MDIINFNIFFSLCFLTVLDAKVVYPSGNSSYYNSPKSISPRAGESVTLFDRANYEGDSKGVTLTSGCTNILDFNDRASSVRISSGCVRLWRDIDCTGGSIDVTSPGEQNLQNRNFNDETTSVSSCDFPCYNEKVDVVMNLNGANDLAQYAATLKRVMQDWFPFIQSNLYTPAYRPFKKIEVNFREDYNGVAYARPGANEIVISTKWARNNQGDTGVAVHEMTHLIQEPGRNCPGWVVEGTAEYMRRWFYEPKTNPTKPTQETMPNDYLGGWLLDYLNTVMKKPIFYTITKTCQEGSWTPSFIKDLTGKDEKEWWRLMVKDSSYPWKRVK